MIAFIIKNKGIVKETSIMDFFGIKFDYGWGNGYVAIEKSHPLYNVDYNDINYHSNLHDVNGGLTFSAEMTGNQILNDGIIIESAVIDRNKKYWVFGFDTKHSFNTAKNTPRRAVVKDTLRLYNSLKEVTNGI